MAEEPFEVSIDRVAGTATLRMSGDLNRSAQEQLDRSYAEVGEGPVVLDFSDVSYINSTGIAVIVGVLAKARANGQAVRAFGLNDHYQQIFRITRIADFLAIFDDETAAVAG